MPTAQEFVAAARRAEQAGNAAAANRLKEAAREALRDAQGRQPQPEPEVDTDQPFFEEVADFGRGVTQGLRDASRWGQKALWRTGGALGLADDDTVDDMLNIVNHKARRDEERNAEVKDRSPLGFGAGELTGETLFTLPIGGVGGAAGKGAVNAGRAAWAGKPLTGAALKEGGIRASGAGLAAEGAAIGAYTSEGENVAEAAAQGAAVDLIGGAAINAVSRAGGAFVRDRVRKRGARREVDGQLQAGKQRVEDAREHGGYTLDGATALASQRGHDELARMGKDGVLGQRLRDHRAGVEQQVTARARQEAEAYGPVQAGTVLGQVDSVQLKGQKEKALVPAQRTLAALKLVDERKYRQLYREFDRLAGETSTYLDTRPMGQQIAEARKAQLNSASKGLARKLDSDLARYGIALDGSKPRIGKDSKPLRLEGVEDLIQDLNAHYSPSLNAGERKYIQAIRTALEGAADNALQELGERAGAGSAVYEAGKRAREARRAFSEKWDSKDVIQKLAERTDGGEFRMDYAQALPVLTKGGAKDLRKVKARLLTAKRGQEAWKSLQQSPILEALYEATKDNREAVLEGGVVKFDTKKFRGTLERLLGTEDAKEALWGKDGTARVNRMVDSWMDRYRKPDTSGSGNPSGTAASFAKQLRWMPGGLGREFLQALPIVGETLARGSRTETAEAVLTGKVPQNVKDEMVADLLADWESRYVGAGGQRYGDMLRQLARTGVTVEITKED